MGQTNSCVYEKTHDVLDSHSVSSLKIKLKEYDYRNRLKRLRYAEENIFNVLTENKDLYDYFINKYVPLLGEDEYITQFDDREYKTNVEKLARLTHTDKHSEESFMWCLSVSINRIKNTKDNVIIHKKHISTNPMPRNYVFVSY